MNECSITTMIDCPHCCPARRRVIDAGPFVNLKVTT
jgi:hypothetical protein